MPSNSLVFQAPAKLNLCLRVTNRRPDGYHDLYSLMTFVAVYDTLTLTRPTHAKQLITLHANGTGTLANEDNLAYRAAQHAYDVFSIKAPIALTLDKRLPIAAGLGGGSSDAAACLRLICAAFDLDRYDQRWGAIAQQLGADVPFFWHGLSAIAEGIGERLTPCTLPQTHVLLANPRLPINTPDVFRALKPPFRGKPDTPLTHLATTNQLWHALTDIGNDLLPPASKLCVPLASLLDALRATPCQLANLSGSGATCFALYEKQTDAEQALVTLKQKFPTYWFCTTTTLNRSPPVTFLDL